MHRAAWLLRTADRQSRILELGPSYSPIAPKSAGWRTHVVDHDSQQALREKYAPAGVDIEAIEEVDTVWRGQPLDGALPAALLGTFDLILASHVIEHLPDFIGFLGAAERVLQREGAIALAVPDRRYCFDFFKPITLTGDLLEAHAARRVRHARRTAWNQLAYSVQEGGAGAWGNQTLHDLRFAAPFAAAATAAAAYRDDDTAAYDDCHAWHFTPAAFRLAFLELGHLGAIDWHIEALEAPWGTEFFALLRRGAEHCETEAALQIRRMALLHALMAEERDQIECLLAPAARPAHGARPSWGALPLLAPAS